MSEKPSVLTKMAQAVSSMSPALRRSLLIVLVGVLCLLVGWIGRSVLTGPPSDSDTVTAYDTWQVICPSAKAKDGACGIVREVIDDKTSQRVGRIALGREKGKKDETLVLTVPLGVFLRPGLGFRLGGEPVKSYQYSTCSAEGCMVVTPLDQKLRDTLLAAQDATLIIATPQDRDGIEFTFSMKGFVKAEKAYRTGEAKRKSLWWRLWL
jgi:invasion protein IalB